ncbi:MAG: enoyl-CoA hydratase-related protein [Solirubrobacteraceae bacterium]
MAELQATARSSGTRDSEPPVLVEDRDAIRWVLLNRPSARNAQNAEMLSELARVLELTIRDPTPRVLVLGGVGSSFSAGHDLKEAAVNPLYRANIETVEGRLRQELDLFVRPIELLRALPMPTICRVQGHCIAASLMLVGAVDLVVASADASFSSAVTRDMGAADVEIPSLAWMLGDRRAKQMIWCSERFDAEQALRLGIVNWVVAVGELDAKVEATAQSLAAVPREALALSKMSFRFMDDRRGRADAEAYHYLAHQLSHHTADAVALLRARVGELEARLGDAAS